jgi:hypothetical protein
MKTVKTLILAVRILLSLGIGTAMAQPESASMHTDFHRMVNVPTRSHQATTHRILAGSADVDSIRSRPHVFLFAGQCGTVANPAEPGDHLEANEQ